MRLRVLATTDMHMHVLPYNYLADRPSNRVGLARVGALIAAHRRDHPNVLLLDNGDFLQGTALGDYVAAAQSQKTQSRHAAGTHPAVAAMNLLRYDAITLGNHDFNYGLSFLRRALSRATFPVTVANARMRHGPAVRPWVILDRSVQDVQGKTVALRIGLIGFLPPQTAVWDAALSADLLCEDILEAARREVPRLRAAGADVVIALAHSGIGHPQPAAGTDNAAAALAALPGIDALVIGHTHQVFPGPDIPPAPGIDPVRGTLAGKPAVMAGFGGSHLGRIDLNLRGRPGRWQIADFTVTAEPVPANGASLPALSAPVMGLHRATLRHYRRRIGHTPDHLHSFFSVLGDDRALRLVAMAQRWHVRGALKGGPWAHLPILSAAAPFRAGGRAGPDHYTDVPAGALTLRSLSDLYIFPNHLRAVVVTGAELRDWLERSASMFHRLTPGARDAALIDPEFPSYNFEVVDGVTWRFDLTAPARYGPEGMLRDPGGPGRIRDLTHRGRAVREGDRFVLATNSYRLAACGMFAAVAPPGPVVLSGETLTRDVLRDYVRRRRHLTVPSGPGWQFMPLPDTTALVATNPAALDHLDALRRSSGLRIESADQSRDGFALLRLFL